MSDDIAEVQVKVEVGSLVEVVDITLAELPAESTSPTSNLAPTKFPSTPTSLPSAHACNSTHYAIAAPSATRILPLKAIQPLANIFDSSTQSSSVLVYSSSVRAYTFSALAYSSAVRAYSFSAPAYSSFVRAYNSSVPAQNSTVRASSGVLSAVGTPVLALNSATYLAPLVGTKTLWCTLMVLFCLDIVVHHAA